MDSHRDTETQRVGIVEMGEVNKLTSEKRDKAIHTLFLSITCSVSLCLCGINLASQ